MPLAALLPWVGRSARTGQMERQQKDASHPAEAPNTVFLGGDDAAELFTAAYDSRAACNVTVALCEDDRCIVYDRT